MEDLTDEDLTDETLSDAPVAAALATSSKLSTLLYTKNININSETSTADTVLATAFKEAAAALKSVTAQAKALKDMADEITKEAKSTGKAEAVAAVAFVLKSSCLLCALVLNAVVLSLAF